jgi:hypothetical protein
MRRVGVVVGTLEGMPSHLKSTRKEWPVYLVGCHRSGTTLARYLLDAHPALACPPESKFLCGVEAFLLYPQVLAGLGGIGISLERVLAEWRRIIETFMVSYTAGQGKRRWVDKTPNYVRLLDLIDRIFDREVLYLIATRHPADVVESLMTFEPFAAEMPEDPDIAQVVSTVERSPEGWARHWVSIHERIADFVSKVPDRCCVFRYEDLVLHTEPTLDAICAAIDEENPGTLIRDAFVQHHTSGYEDPKARGLRHISGHGIRKWERQGPELAEKVWRIAGPCAESFGYRPPSSRCERSS